MIVPASVANGERIGKHTKGGALLISRGYECGGEGEKTIGAIGSATGLSRSFWGGGMGGCLTCDSQMGTAETKGRYITHTEAPTAGLEYCCHIAGEKVHYHSLGPDLEGVEASYLNRARE